MIKLQVVPRHRLVDRQVVDHVIVVFGQEAGRLRIGPVVRDRADRVEVLSAGTEPRDQRGSGDQTGGGFHSKSPAL